MLNILRHSRHARRVRRLPLGWPPVMTASPLLVMVMV